MSNKLPYYSILIIGILVFAIYSFTGGLMTTNDSIHYLVSGFNLFEHGELISIKDKPLTAFPPLYPLLISFILKFSKTLNSLTVFHIILYFINSILVHKFYDKYLNSKYVKLGAFMITIWSSFYIINHIFIWSEGFFYTLSFFWFFQTLKLQKNQNLINTVIYITIGILLCMQRKTGFILILSSGVYFLLQKENWNFKKLSSIFIISFLASIFTLYWRIRASLISQNFLYNKHFSFTQTWNAINQEVTELGTWLIPRTSPDWAKWILILLLIVFIFKQLIDTKTDESTKLSLILFFVYSSTIITFMTFYKLSQTMDIRVMGSIAPFIVLIVAQSIEKFQNKSTSKIFNYIIMSAFFVILLYNLARSYKNLEQWKNVKKLTFNEILKKN